LILREVGVDKPEIPGRAAERFQSAIQVAPLGDQEEQRAALGDLGLETADRLVVDARLGEWLGDARRRRCADVG